MEVVILIKYKDYMILNAGFLDLNSLIRILSSYIINLIPINITWIYNFKLICDFSNTKLSIIDQLVINLMIVYSY